ncbi:hypothetical protein, partial [Zooshikella harenae]
ENTLVLDFDSLHQLVKATLNDTASVSYEYDEQQRLVTTTFPDQSTRQFLYENTDFPFYLTGVMDSKGNRAITWTYDSAGRAIVSERADNNEKFVFEYNDNQTTVTNPLGKKTTYTFENFYGIKKVVRVEGHASSNCTAANKSYTYFDNGLLKSKTDWKGVITSYEYNDRGLLARTVAASGTTDEQETLTEWHDTFRLPTRITEANRT